MQKLHSTRHRASGFTLLELVVVLVLLAFLFCIIGSGLSHTSPPGKRTSCINNLRQLTVAFIAWSMDNNDNLLACGDSFSTTRLKWVTGSLDYSPNTSNYNTNTDLTKSPIWPIVGTAPAVFRCPADASTVKVSGVVWPRVRSYSLSGVFGAGGWLDKTFNANQTVWRTYAKSSEIVQPANTIVFADMHPDSINDSEFKAAATGSQPGDAPAAAQIIDLPSSSHLNSGNLSFADGRVESHRWVGTAIRPQPLYTLISLNFAARDSWMDSQWLGTNLTVRR